MTCKDCIHSGLCYKENCYDNFPDRCGSFISNKILEEKQQSKWVKNETRPKECQCANCGNYDLSYFPFCHWCGAGMRGKEE